LLNFTKDPEKINILSIYKGWFYVLITGILLFFLVRKENTKRNRLYNELLSANQKALRSERMQYAFLANLSHYIRTPMNSILGFVELIQNRDINEEKRKRFLLLINEKSHQLLQTINNIIEISKIQEGQINLDNTEFSIKSMINKLVNFYKQEIRSKQNTTLIFHNIDFDSNKDLIVADYNKIYHIFSNLLNNAVNFTNGGEIEIGYTFSNNMYIFSVRDTGCGISEEKKKTLFLNFMQGRHDIQEASEGSGIGLFLSASMAKLMGGKLWLEHSDDKGSLFIFSIPDC
jgi:signal transduction histidine kinase